MPKSKRVRRRERPPAEPVPKTAESPDFGGSNPSWQIHILQTQGPFGWDVLDKEKLEQIRQRLANFETMTWNEILVKGKNEITRFRLKTFPEKTKNASGRSANTT